MNTLRRERKFRGYKSSQKILLVGEGDFSFSASLARALRTAENIVATSYVDENWLVEKYWTSVPHLDLLDRLGGVLLYEVDVYNMDTHPTLKHIKFDVIIFNFPHAGHYDYLCESDLELIEMHRELVGAYFKSASKMLNEGGEVHLRHREDPPYDSWNVILLAHEAGLKLKEKEHFFKSDYPGYHNKRGGDIQTNKTFPILCASTFKFALDLPKVINQHPKKYEGNYDYHNDLLQNKGEIHVLEMTDDQKYFKSGAVNDDFLKDETTDNNFGKKVEANDDLFVHKNDEVVHLSTNSDFDIHAIEMKEHFLEEHDVLPKNDKFDDDDGDSLEKDEVHDDRYLPTVGDDQTKIVEVNRDHGLLKENQVDELETKDQDIDMNHLNNDEDHDLPKKDDSVHVSMNDEVHCYLPKTNKLDNDHFNNDKVDNDHPNNDDVCDDLNNIYGLDVYDDLDVLAPPKMKNDVMKNEVDDLDAQMLEIKSLVEELHININVHEMIKVHDNVVG